MNTAIYIRYSEDCPGPSIEEQRKVCRKYAAEHGYAITMEYVDFASGIDNDQDIFAKIVCVSKTQQSCKILVYSTSRAIVDTQTIAPCKVTVEKYGENLISIVEPYQTDQSTALIEKISRSFAEYYRKQQSESIKRGIRLAKERKAALAAKTEAA